MAQKAAKKTTVKTVSSKAKTSKNDNSKKTMTKTSTTKKTAPKTEKSKKAESAKKASSKEKKATSAKVKETKTVASKAKTSAKTTSTKATSAKSASAKATSAKASSAKTTQSTKKAASKSAAPKTNATKAKSSANAAPKEEKPKSAKSAKASSLGEVKNSSKSEGTKKSSPKTKELVSAQAHEADMSAGDMDDDEDEKLDPAVQKLLDYARPRQVVTWDEITEILTQDFVNSSRMEEVLQLLTQNNIQVMEETEPLLDDEDDEEGADDDEELGTSEGEISDESSLDDAGKHRLVANDKESGVDDPIRLYLREIGKENLLTADQEVILSRKMEDGQNIIKDVIKHSGMMIPEFFGVAQKAFTRIDIHEPGRPRKEINEEMAEKRRLKSCYSEYLKPVLPEMKQYMALKKQLSENDQTMNIFQNPQIVSLRTKIYPSLQKMEIQTEEIERFSSKFLEANERIEEYHLKQEKRMKELRISDPAGLRSIGRRLAIRTEAAKLEKDLGLTADEIREVYTQIQKIDRKLRRIEYDFENSVEEIIDMTK